VDQVGDKIDAAKKRAEPQLPQYCTITISGSALPMGTEWLDSAAVWSAGSRHRFFGSFQVSAPQALQPGVIRLVFSHPSNNCRSSALSQDIVSSRGQAIVRIGAQK
jgi:hypothetical protein